MMIISPSLLSGNLLNLERQLDALKGIENLHLDIDDGNFVRGISFGASLARAIAGYTDIPLDVHLEVANPCDCVDEYCDLRIDRICAHLEALPYPSLFLSRVRRGRKRAGLALNLKTPVDAILPYADQIDYLLLVSVEADCEGIAFRRGVLGKIRRAREILPKGVPVWVDGGINEDTMRDVISCGAAGLVMGRAVFVASDPAAEYARLLAAAEAMASEGGDHA
jgi:ribulose-phosphate 3-epimerase